MTKDGDKLILQLNLKRFLDNSVTYEAWLMQIKSTLYWYLYGIENRN